MAVQEDEDGGKPIIINCESANIESRTNKSRAITFTHSVTSINQENLIINQKSMRKQIKALAKPRASVGQRDDLVASEAKRTQIVTDELPRENDLYQLKNRPSQATLSDGATQKRDNSGSRLFSPEHSSVNIFGEAK